MLASWFRSLDGSIVGRGRRQPEGGRASGCFRIRWKAAGGKRRRTRETRTGHALAFEVRSRAITARRMSRETEVKLMS